LSCCHSGVADLLLVVPVAAPALRRLVLCWPFTRRDGELDISSVSFLNAGLYSRALFTWLTPLMVLGFKRPLEEADVPPLAAADTASHLFFAFRREWQKELRGGGSSGVNPKASLVRALVATCGTLFFSAALFKLCQDLLTFVGPYLLSSIIIYLQVWRRALSAAIASCTLGAVAPL
jgi:hypothetical protein